MMVEFTTGPLKVKVLLNILRIHYVMPAPEGAVIRFGEGPDDYFIVTESYADVKAKLDELFA